MDLKAVLKTKVLNRWPLFWLISIPMSMVMVVEMLQTDISVAPGVSEMIGFSVRWAVPFICVTVAASSLRVLLPGAVSFWLLRNRKYIGLCFAVAMAWQGFFIYLMSGFHREYYFEEIFYLRDELEGSTGYIFLAAMVVTSFQFGRQYLSLQQWHVLHKSGLYFLWAYPYSVYWWNLYYYPNPEAIDYVFYGIAFTAFALRIAAWGKLRQQGAQKAGFETPVLLRSLGALVVAGGLLMAATGLSWQKPVSEALTGPAWSANLELWLPYWPFEPFLPLFVLGLGTLLFTWTKAQVSESLAT